MSKKIAVTGGTGFVGGAVIRAALAAGWEVHSYGRREVAGTEFHQWDAVQMRPVVRGSYDAIIHCAAAATDWGNRLLISGTNIRGTRNALDIDPDARFVHLSTASVYSSSQRSGHRLHEDTFLGNDFLNFYAQSKADAEKLVLKDDRSAGSVILRPHAIYGPGDTTLLPRVEQAARRGRLLLPNGGYNLASLTRIDNLVRVIIEMIEVESLDHKIYNVSDGNVVTLRTALNEMLTARGKTVRIIGIRPDIAWKIGKSAEWLYNELEAKKAPPLTRYIVSQLGYEQTLNISRIERQLGRRMPSSDFSDAANWDKEVLFV
jgi:nucleoside-diphosphate-sugar epimerase